MTGGGGAVNRRRRIPPILSPIWSYNHPMMNDPPLSLTAGWYPNFREMSLSVRISLKWKVQLLPVISPHTGKWIYFDANFGKICNFITLFFVFLEFWSFRFVEFCWEMSSILKNPTSWTRFSLDTKLLVKCLYHFCGFFGQQGFRNQYILNITSIIMFLHFLSFSTGRKWRLKAWEVNIF